MNTDKAPEEYTYLYDNGFVYYTLNKPQDMTERLAKPRRGKLQKAPHTSALSRIFLALNFSLKREWIVYTFKGTVA
jgi:hypothetical protein